MSFGNPLSTITESVVVLGGDGKDIVCVDELHTIVQVAPNGFPVIITDVSEPSQISSSVKRIENLLGSL